MRLLVTGGRRFTDRAAVDDMLDRAHAYRPITLLIHGAARGADSLAQDWAHRRGVPDLPFPIAEEEWDAIGPAAGPRRNSRMLIEGKPDGVLAFPGNRGTADMVKQADRAGVPVWQPYRDSQCG